MRRKRSSMHSMRSGSAALMNEARLRMTRVPKAAELVLNKVSGAPGFWIGNVIVMAGVPSIMQAMLDEVAPKLKVGVRMFSETVRADLAGEPQWRMTPHNPSPIWRNHISGALALRSQPTGVVLPDNGHRLCGVVHAARYLHVLRARESSARLTVLGVWGDVVLMAWPRMD